GSELVPESERLESAESELAGERAEFDARFGEGVAGPTGQAAEVRGELTALRASVDAGRGEMSRLEIRLDALEERGERLSAASTPWPGWSTSTLGGRRPSRPPPARPWPPGS